MDHYCYLTKIISDNGIKLYFGKHSSRCGLNNKYIGSGKAIKDAKKNPSIRFEKYVLATFETAELNAEFENLLIREAKEKFSNCVNIADGGDGGRVWEIHPMSGLKRPCSNERKLKISKSMKEKFKTQSHWAKDSTKISKRSSAIPWDKETELYSLWLSNNKPKRGKFGTIAKNNGFPAVDYAGMVEYFKRKVSET
ncbi:intron-associated endonuclease [Klebsiella phage vB_KpnM_VPA32]|nr:intron-associated endonuclease [Klebsiella phage vB_KpnM_VPA32]WOF01333.1 endonuclease [Enterobacter phage vB_Ent31]